MNAELPAGVRVRRESNCVETLVKQQQAVIIKMMKVGGWSDLGGVDGVRRGGRSSYVLQSADTHALSKQHNSIIRQNPTGEITNKL